MELRMEKLPRSASRSDVKAIYEAAFEKEDRMPFFMMLAMGCLWNTEFLAFFDGETLCGFVYMATLGRQTFIMFFAVDEKLRSRGYGGRILKAVQKLHPNNKIIVSIETCEKAAKDIALRQRRKRFYLNCGYAQTGYFMRLGGGKAQELLIQNGTFSKGAFLRFFMLY